MRDVSVLERRSRRRRFLRFLAATAVLTLGFSPLLAPGRLARAQGGSALLADAEQITREVVRIRQLAVRSPIAKGVATRDQIRARVSERIKESYKPDEVRAEGQTLMRLGLLPPGSDYVALVTALLKDQVAGFYDPFKRKLFIADWVPAAFQKPALAHEIAHALADQHFGLKRFVQPQKGEADRQLAHAALVEGDGTLLMLQYTLGALGAAAQAALDKIPDVRSLIAAQLKNSPQSQTLASAPRFLRESLLFPYLEGLGLVHQAYKRGGWKRVDALYRDPPASTEQVMHPEKYLGPKRDLPVRIRPGAVPALERAGWKVLHREVLGEFQAKVFLEVHGVAEAQAARAAAGWGGDRLVAYVHRDGRVAVVWRTEWDTAQDATDFAQAASQAVARITGTHVQVKQRGQGVVVLVGAPQAQAAAIIASAFGWRAGGR